MSTPIAYDLYAGLGGWTEGLLAEGYAVTGFDIEEHVYGEHRYPGQLILKDVLTLDGALLKDAQLIVGSSPCQEFSYRAMPWSRARALPPPVLGIELFQAQFRIQREASAAAGHPIPMVVENVCGAQKWVGRARWHYGSFYLWGDVPALMPMVRKAVKVGGLDWNKRIPGQAFNTHAENLHIKNTGGSWFGVAHNTTSGKGQNPDGRSIAHTLHMTNPMEHVRSEEEGIKARSPGHYTKPGSGPDWFDGGPARHGSRTTKRKMAAAMIAKIPAPLSRHIARVYHPDSARGRVSQRCSTPKTVQAVRPQAQGLGRHAVARRLRAAGGRLVAALRYYLGETQSDAGIVRGPPDEVPRVHFSHVD